MLKQHNDLNSAHNQLRAAYSQLEALHNQKTVEYGNQISNLKRTVLGGIGRGHPTANTSLPLPQPRIQTQPQTATSSAAQAVTGARAPTSPVASTSKQAIDWNSDQVRNYIVKNKGLLNASQQECATLKHRIAELTAQLDAKSKPDANTVTAIEKAELMEAELEGLHERLDKCEEDLNAAQSELVMAKARNTELASEIEQHQAFARQAEFTSRINALEREIVELTKARDAALADIDDWEQNRGMWKRWGEAMALRARQWEEEAQKARKPRSDQAGLHNKVQLEVPPPLTPLSTATMLLSPISSGEPGSTRKRPHDLPDTDVDGHCDVGQLGSDETVQGRPARTEEIMGSGRKKARFAEGLDRGT
ncbi:hypothetical protein FRC07_001283 [Ceratobasidium sp. 392]|nr:hypothetical protein FRC07_001283 [Ceratobasidium sp. 392]